MGIGIQFADQRIPVFFGAIGKMGDKGLDQFAARAAECFGATEISGIRLHEVRIEFVLADQKTELMPETRLAVTGTVGRTRSARCRRWWRHGGRPWRTRKRTQLLDGAETDPISLAKGPIDRSSLGHWDQKDSGAMRRKTRKQE